MRVVLFCGGLGMRLRDYSETIPKPMVQIGYRPLIWWVMKYYAHFGYRDFILCLGYKGDVIKEYFLSYNECRSNDFVLSQGGKRVEPLQKDIEDWRITFVDTGINANIGERLMAVEPFLRDEEIFLANYSDGLTDFPLPVMVDAFARSSNIATFLSVRPNSSFHFVTRREDGLVTSIDDVLSANAWINGGFFVLRREIFDYMRPGDELVVEPFQRLIGAGRLATQAYDGFWRCVDTFKDLQALDTLYTKGRAPWELWRREPAGVARARATAPAAEREPAGWQVRAGS
ncbi:MAG: sugar phosphate nucleotidyltransferase [Stellaceae bacterium]